MTESRRNHSTARKRTAFLLGAASGAIAVLVWLRIYDEQLWPTVLATVPTSRTLLMAQIMRLPIKIVSSIGLVMLTFGAWRTLLCAPLLGTPTSCFTVVRPLSEVSQTPIGRCGPGTLT